MIFKYKVLDSSWWSWMYAWSLPLQNIEESFFWTQQVFEDMTCVFLEIEDMQMIIQVVRSQPSSVWSVLTKWSPSESTWLWRVPTIEWSHHHSCRRRLVPGLSHWTDHDHSGEEGGCALSSYYHKGTWLWCICHFIGWSYTIHRKMYMQLPNLEYISTLSI